MHVPAFPNVILTPSKKIFDNSIIANRSVLDTNETGLELGPWVPWARARGLLARVPLAAPLTGLSWTANIVSSLHAMISVPRAWS